MTQLSAQSIRSLCEPSHFMDNREVLNRDDLGRLVPMISPFLAESQKISGKSAGLSAASYDARIAHDLVLGPHPGEIVRKVMMTQFASGTIEDMLISWNEVHEAITNLPPCRALANTIEDFSIPTNVVGYVCDRAPTQGYT